MTSMKAETATIKADGATMKAEITMMKADIANLHTAIARLEEKGDTRHEQMMQQLKEMKLDQDFIWEKTVKTERDFGVFKKQMGM